MKLIFLILAAILFSTQICLATPEIFIDAPFDQQEIREHDFTLLYRIVGNDTNSGLDHVHWQIDDGPKPTAPDLGGVDNVIGVAEGLHTLSVWMATVDHIRIGEKKTININIATSGVEILTPLTQSTVAPSDIKIFYSLWGEPLAELSHVVASLDGNMVGNDLAGSGVIEFKAVGDGAHSIELWMVDANLTQLRSKVTTSVLVASTLNKQNVRKLMRLLNRSLITKNLKRRLTYLKQAEQILLLMSVGGSRNPSSSGLTHSTVIKARRLLSKVSKVKIDSVNLKKVTAFVRTTMYR